MKTKKYLKIASLAVVAAIFIWTFVFLYRKSQPTVKVYETIVPETADLEKTTVATGKVEPRDDFLKDPELYKSRIPFYKSEISKCTYRQYTTGFFFGKPDENTQIYESNTYIKEYTYLGIVGDMNEEGLYNIEQRNKFSVGEQIEVMRPDGENIQVTVKRITDDKGKDMESCPHPKQQLYIDLGVKLDRYDILRRKEE